MSLFQTVVYAYASFYNIGQNEREKLLLKETGREGQIQAVLRNPLLGYRPGFAPSLSH